MNLYLKQQFFSWGDKFFIYDAGGNEKYYVEGEIFSFGKKLHIYDLSDNEVAYIEQRLFSFFPRYTIYKGNDAVAEVTKEFSFFKQEYTVEGTGWSVLGDFFDHEYEITKHGAPVAEVSKQWFTLGDAYEIFINEDSGADEVTVLATVLVIDACIEADNN
jgi:uncharacterized protein YxjI